MANDVPPQNTGGEPMCSMAALWTWLNKTIGLVMLKWSGDLGLFMHIVKSNWRIPEGEKIPMSIAFDNGVREGSGFVIEDNPKKGATIQINVKEDAEGFMADFANADTMTLSFTEGSGNLGRRRWSAAARLANGSLPESAR